MDRQTIGSVKLWRVARMLRNVLVKKGLSSREVEVALLITKGYSNKKISKVLYVTEKTIKFHLTNIYRKLSVKSRSQLIVWCVPYMERPGSGTVRDSVPHHIPSGSSPVGETTSE